MINGEIIVDNFAGGGGASTGIEMATGYSVDIAINHDPEAIKMHKANHPRTKHYCEDVWQVDPIEACQGRPVALAWFSPDCKHFSKAKGGKPKEKKIRGLAWVACRWAGLVRPRVIMLENVEEFKTWGPLNRSHRPIKAKRIGTEKWVVGYYVKTAEASYITVPFPEANILGEEGKIIEVDPDTLCQYTGLTDKNGRKIWENDVVKYHFGNDVAPIKFGEYQSCFDSTKAGHIGFYLDWDCEKARRKDLGYWVNMIDCNIVGNTFDNPELLEGGAE